jgi:hypothetical protein
MKEIQAAKRYDKHEPPREFMEKPDGLIGIPILDAQTSPNNPGGIRYHGYRNTGEGKHDPPRRSSL